MISNACFASKSEPKNVKKDKSINIVNFDGLDSDDQPIGKRLAPSIAKRLRKRTRKGVASASKPSKAPKKTTSVGPAKRWSKVVAPVTKKRSLKRKGVPSCFSDYDFDVEHGVQYIISAARKNAYMKKVPANIPEVPIDNISFLLS